MDILIFSVVVAAAAFLLWQCHSKRKHLLVELKACQEKCARAIDTAQADNTRWNSLHQSQLEEIAQLHKRSQVFQGRLKEVEPYLGIVDAQREAAQMVDQAQKRAQDIVAKGQGDSDALAEKAAERLAQADKIALRAIQTARTTAAQIEAEARQRAGEAMDLKGRESELREQVQALENRVKGYDDSYLQPATLLLEGLADHYGHEDAAQALKHARTNTKDMLRSETAADCDYVENHRRSTAIRFVIMAFNGEVDAILSLVKTDNVGVLKRKIQDAFSLVNLHGAAFRNARVTQAFLESRLAELEAAARFQQLLKAEQEQQKAIREKMRDEARAQREFEAAQKEAAKEEERARKAYEEAKRRVEAASAEDRVALEAKMQQLEQALADAQAKGQRALSMAQQTRSGHCYIISNVGSFGEDVLKIGLTRRLDPQDRIKELGDASVPFGFDVHALIYSDDAPKLERTLHETFNEFRLNLVNPRKEFFKVPLQAVREKIVNDGHKAEFTLAADAYEWRESESLRKGNEEQRRSALRAVLALEEGLDDEQLDIGLTGDPK